MVFNYILTKRNLIYMAETKPANEEENILKTIMEKESWEDVIYYIVSLEGIDPWNVDLVKLTESFIKFMNAVKELDFRIPAKIVFVAAILLRLKSDYLSFFEEEKDDETLKQSKPFEELGIDPNLIQLGYPMKRIPKRQVTLDELMEAMKRAMNVKDRKEVRKKLWTGDMQRNMDLQGEAIEVRIERIMKDIDKLLLSSEKVEFKKVVKDWKRDKIVENFVPVLHLEQDEKIKTEQEDFFKEIFIKKNRPVNDDNQQ